jgi:SAM-dependent methyltransferase
MTEILNNITRLSFTTHAEYLDFARDNRRALTETWLWHEEIGNKECSVAISGVCDLCVCRNVYTAITKPVSDNQFEHRAEWWHGFNCRCGMSASDRTVFRALLDGGAVTDAIYHVGHHSPMAAWLRKRCSKLTTSQYEAGRAAGETEGGIRYESLFNLSFPDATFDCVIAMEILEHLSDYRCALKEMRRVLRPGGRLLMTFPWLGKEHYEHLTRAEERPDGSVFHIHTPQYHGDPAKPGVGILSYRDFGWKILDELRDVGFSHASANYVFGPLHGYVSLHNPVVVGSVGNPCSSVTEHR